MKIKNEIRNDKGAWSEQAKDIARKTAFFMESIHEKYGEEISLDMIQIVVSNEVWSSTVMKTANSIKP